MCTNIVMKNFLIVLVFLFSFENFGDCKLDFEDFTFVCPNGFDMYRNQCVTDQVFCPSLSFLSKNYDILPENKTNLDSVLFDRKCKYSINDITETNDQNVTVKLDLVFQNSKRPYKLWIYVFSDYPIEYVEKKVACWSKRHTTNPVNFTEISISKANTRKFFIKLDVDLKYYFCRFIDPGVIKPATSNKIIASINARNIFRISVNEYAICSSTIIDNNNLHYKNEVYFTSVDSEDMNTGTDIVDDRYSSETCFAIHINSTEFCSDDRIFASTISAPHFRRYFYPQTKIGSATISTPICFDKSGIPFSRKCIGDGLLIAQWENVITCYPTSLSPITSLLENVNLTAINENDLTNISQSLTNVHEMNSIDLNLISNILQKSPTDSLEYSEKMLQITNNILKTDVETSNVLTTAKDTFLENVEGYVENLAKTIKNVTVILPNIAYSIKQPFLMRPNVDFQAKLNNVTIILPNGLLNSLNLSKSEKNNFTISIVSYKNDDFFRDHQKISDVVDIVINIPVDKFEEPLSIFLTSKNKSSKVTCVFWNVDNESWDNFGIETSLPLDDGTVECKTNHLTRFSLLIVSHDIIDQHKIPFFVRGFWTFESIASFIGVSTILIMTCIMPKEWRVKRRKTIHLSISIVLEILVLWISEYVPALAHGVSCTILGTSIHYIVLVKNILMFLIAKVEYQKFMSALENSTKRNPCVSYSDIFTVWIIPAGIIAIAYISSKELFEVKANICAPKGALFIFFELLPVTILMFINMSIYIIIVTKLAFIQSKKDLHQKRQLMQAILLWFMFGICWIFGVLCNMLNPGYVQTSFYYIHGFIAPLQGLIIFIFSVLLVKKRYKKFC